MYVADTHLAETCLAETEYRFEAQGARLAAEARR